MTRDEAKKALVQGKTVRHAGYSTGEWLRFNGSYLYTEDGYHHQDFNGDFWNKYQWWETGWEIVSDNNS